MSKIYIKLKKKSQLYYAEAVYNTDTNIVTLTAKKTKISPSVRGNISSHAKNMRGDVENNCDSNRILQSDVKIFTQNSSDTPLSTAALVVAGFTNGLNDWEIIGGDFPGYNGKSMGDWVNDYKKGSSLSESAPVEEVESASRNDSDIYNYLAQNVIFYGVPGCGKSFFIENLLKTKDDDGKIIDMPRSYYKRILFHPEYSYSDFVGQLRPEVGDDNKITYKFAPGVFTEILRDAYKDREHNYFLIIEEINRGNAPAIFGDLFQLLDRKDGVSEYSIDNKDILDYFKRESEKDDTGAMAQVVETIEDGIRIPKNLTIFATMNTCDQNVFTLDTAFKRRWRMSRIVNNFDEDSSISAWEISFKHKSDGFLWKEFAKAVNDAILNNCNDGTAAEDKQLGTHFIKECDLTPARRFAEKVLLYLWDDVAKYDKSQLFNTNKYKTLDMVIDGFAEGENVFSPNCAELQKLYNNMKQPGQTDENTAGVPSGAAPGTDSSVKNAATDEEQGGK